MDPSLTIVIKKVGPSLQVSGSANLPDGARLRCGAWRGGPEGSFEDVSHDETTVEGGQFAIRIDGRSAWFGAVSASVELRADHTQPDHVRAAIGDAGERLLYADITGPSYSQVFAVASADLGPEPSGHDALDETPAAAE